MVKIFFRGRRAHLDTRAEINILTGWWGYVDVSFGSAYNIKPLFIFLRYCEKCWFEAEMRRVWDSSGERLLGRLDF